MPDGCARYSIADAPRERRRREPPAGGDKPLHGYWLLFAEALSQGPRGRAELKQSLGLTHGPFSWTLCLMAKANLIEGRDPIALTERGLERYRQAHARRMVD